LKIFTLHSLIDSEFAKNVFRRLKYEIDDLIIENSAEKCVADPI